MTSVLGSSRGGEAVTVYVNAPQWQDASSRFRLNCIFRGTMGCVHCFLGASASGAVGSATSDLGASDMLSGVWWAGWLEM
jgi:hypothetical protein